MRGCDAMPNRILKESICRSEEIDKLSWFEEVMFYRLMVNCDDYGRFDGRTRIIKSYCFPLKDVTEKDITNGLEKLSRVGLIEVYEAQGRPYLQLTTWGDHQRIRNQKSKFPALTDENQKLTLSDDKITKAQPETVPGSEKRSDVIDENEEASVIALPLNDGTEHKITLPDIEEWSALYPAVDILQELRNMRGWLLSNPGRRKTRRGISRFITAWLQKEQDRPSGQQTQAGRSMNTEAYMQSTNGWWNDD